MNVDLTRDELAPILDCVEARTGTDPSPLDPFLLRKLRERMPPDFSDDPVEAAKKWQAKV
jgi:hypothetical protein